MLTSRYQLRQGAISVVLAGFLLTGCGDKGAEQQKQAGDIAKGIEDYLALIEVPSQPLRIRHDKVTVTPAEDGKSYAVAITGVRYGSEKQANATFGEIDYTLTPQGDDQFQVTDLKLPKEVAIVGADGKPEGSVKFETTAFTATWSKPLQNFLKFDWQVKDIAATDVATPGEMFKIASASITGDGKESGKGLLDQVSKVTFNGFTANDPTDKTTIKLDKLVGNIAFTQLDFPAYRQMMAKVSDFSAKYAPPVQTDGAPAVETPKLTDEDRKALAEMVKGFPKLMASYGYDFTAEGFSVSDAQGQEMFHLNQGGVGFGLKGINTDKAEASFSLKHDGLTLNGPEFESPMTKAALPKSGSLSLVATDLPVPTLVENIAKVLPELTSADPQVAQGGQIMLMGALMSALSQSDIKLRIDPSVIESEKARITAEGEFKLAMETPQKAVGVVNLALFGLDDLIALATSLADQDPEAGQAMGVFQMIQSMAQRETGSDGKPVDKFKVELTDTGATLINGKSLDSIAP
jgi:hypothetical protein